MLIMYKSFNVNPWCGHQSVGQRAVLQRSLSFLFDTLVSPGISNYTSLFWACTVIPAGSRSCKKEHCRPQSAPHLPYPPQRKVPDINVIFELISSRFRHLSVWRFAAVLLFTRVHPRPAKCWHFTRAWYSVVYGEVWIQAPSLLNGIVKVKQTKNK